MAGLEDAVRRKTCALRAAGQRRDKDLQEAAREASTAWGRARSVQDALDAAQQDNASLVTRVDDFQERVGGDMKSTITPTDVTYFDVRLLAAMFVFILPTNLFHGRCIYFVYIYARIMYILPTIHSL